LVSCITQQAILPKEVVGEAKGHTCSALKKSLWYCSKRVVAPQEEPILTPKFLPCSQPASCKYWFTCVL
jgi:hypothetical protein